MICQENMSCEEIKNKMSDYFDGEIEGPICDEITKHIETCSECNSFFHSFKKSIELCKEYLVDDIPDEVRSRLRECIEKEIQSH